MNQNKGLVKKEEKGVFNKIISFIKNIFYKEIENKEIDNNKIYSSSENIKNKRNDFLESIKTVESEETKILKLQKQYRCGMVKEEELTDNQIKSLCELYDKQIAELKLYNENKRKEILKYKNST